MNYRLHYERLISRARGRIITGYRERHHVVPRCLGGSDDPGNLVDLTGEEHYVAHQLLAKMHPDHAGLTYAALFMSKQATGNKPYGWLRRKYSAFKKGQPGRRFKHTAEAREKMSEARRGRPLTPAQAAARVGRKLTAEHRARVSEALRKRERKPETFAKISAANRGHPVSEETRAKLREKRKTYRHSPETRAKISASNKGKKQGTPSAEHRAKISATLKARWAAGLGENQWRKVA